MASNVWDADDYEDQFRVERRTAIEARLRATFEEQLDAAINAERRKAVEERLRLEFEEGLRDRVKEEFKLQRKNLLREIEERLTTEFEESLPEVITEELARLDEEASVVHADTVRHITKHAQEAA
jgi:hypothetical protein